MNTITKKQINLSNEVLKGNKLYWSKSSITDDIENAIKEVYYEEVEEFGHNYDNSYFNIYAVERKLREKGYRIWGDK